MTDRIAQIKELEQQHLGWLHNPSTSNGQLADSKTILNLIEMLRQRDGMASMDRLRQGANVQA